MFDYSKLRGRTRELGDSQEEVAKAAKMSPATYSLKLTGKSEFKQCEINDICGFLRIPAVYIGEYFFTEAV